MDERFEQVTGFQWDKNNERKSADKHGVSCREAEELFFSDPLIVPDEKHSQTEQRYHALGRSGGGRLLHVTFTMRQEGRLIRVISARDMHRREREFYEQQG